MSIFGDKKKLIGAALFAVSFLLTLIFAWPREPCYEGRNLADWTKDLFFIEGGKDPRTPAFRLKHEQAVTAIRQMMPDVLPFALKLCESRNMEKQNEGGNAIWALGSMAEPAIPNLMDALKNRNHEIAASASYALKGIGTNVISPMITFLADTNINDANRVAAMMVLGHFGSEAERAIPTINPFLKSPNPYVRDMATHMLRRIKGESIPITSHAK